MRAENGNKAHCQERKDQHVLVAPSGNRSEGAKCLD